MSDLSDFKRVVHEPLQEDLIAMARERDSYQACLWFIANEFSYNEDVTAKYLAELAKKTLRNPDLRHVAAEAKEQREALS